MAEARRHTFRGVNPPRDGGTTHDNFGHGEKNAKIRLVDLGGLTPPKVSAPTDDKGGLTRVGAKRTTVRDDMRG